jgi:hypothetical protein
LYAHTNPFFYFGVRTCEAEWQREKQLKRGLIADLEIIAQMRAADKINRRKALAN